MNQRPISKGKDHGAPLENRQWLGLGLQSHMVAKKALRRNADMGTGASEAVVAQARRGRGEAVRAWAWWRDVGGGRGGAVA